VAGLGDGVGELEEEGGLACAGGTGEHHDRGGDEAFAADGVVEPLDAHLLAIAEGGRDRDVRDVGAALETLDADIQVHLAHAMSPFEGVAVTVLIYHVAGRLCTAW